MHDLDLPTFYMRALRIIYMETHPYLKVGTMYSIARDLAGFGCLSVEVDFKVRWMVVNSGGKGS